MTPSPTQQWAVIRYDREYFSSLQNNMCRVGIACVIPMVTEWNHKAKKEVKRPAFQNLAFIPGQEALVQRALSLNYVDEVWRQNGTTALALIPDPEFQAFLEGLAKREKKPARARRVMNLVNMAQKDGFALYAALFGPREAIKKFGKDFRESENVWFADSRAS